MGFGEQDTDKLGVTLFTVKLSAGDVVEGMPLLLMYAAVIE
jgi:hypothetical protein